MAPGLLFSDMETPTVPVAVESLDSLVQFIGEESRKPTPRLALISIMLGEMEEKDGKFPLDTFGITYTKYLEFLEEEMKPCIVTKDKAATVR